MGRKRAEHQALIGRADRSQLGDTSEAEHARRTYEVLLQEDHERRPAGHDHGVVGIGGENLERLLQRLGLDVIERSHRSSRALKIARSMP